MRAQNLLLSNRSSRVPIGVLLALLACMVSVPLLHQPAHAQEYYQWEDEDGTVNFGDTPPPGAKNIKSFSRSNRPRRRAVSDRDRINKEQENLNKDLNEEDSAEDTEDQIDTAKELLAKQKELDRARCNSLRNNLNSYNSGGRVFDTDPTTGERKYLSDDEIAARKAGASKALSEDCQ